MDSQQHRPSQLKINKKWLHLYQQQHNHDHQIMQNPSSSSSSLSLSLPSPTNLFPPHPHTKIPLQINHNPSSSLPSLTNLCPPHPHTNNPLQINHNPPSSSSSSPTNRSPYGIPNNNNPPLLQMIQNPNGEVKVDSGELTETSSLKRKRGRPRGSRKKPSLADTGLGLMPHAISVDVGEITVGSIINGKKMKNVIPSVPKFHSSSSTAPPLPASKSSPPQDDSSDCIISNPIDRMVG